MEISTLAKFFAKRPDLYNQHREKYSQLAPYSLLSTNPPIFFIRNDLHERLIFSSLEIVFEYLKDNTAYFLCNWLWNMEEPEQAYEQKEIEKHHIRKYPHHKFIYLCNTEGQRINFKNEGLNAIFFSNNALIDTKIFEPLGAIYKQFDAVYDAKFSSFKRHYLAREIDSLAFVYYYDPVNDQDCFEEIKCLFPHAHFFNAELSTSYRLLTPSEVNQCLNACKVGLCLSSVEGAMYASIQYLLSGLPVVSTRSKGGRDVFFDEEYALIVEDHPDAVKEGVEEMIRRNISPNAIRSKVLEKVKDHRINLINTIQGIYNQEGVDRDFCVEWNQVYFHKLFRLQKPEWAIQQLELGKRN